LLEQRQTKQSRLATLAVLHRDMDVLKLILMESEDVHLSHCTTTFV
jgi:hypothetical protein